MNGRKSIAEMSDYQKRVENIDNAILCVAEAEKMVNAIGQDLRPEPHLHAKRFDRKRMYRLVMIKLQLDWK